MKILYGLLVISVTAVLVSVALMWWRLRRHLKRDAGPEGRADTSQPEHEPAE